MLEVIFASQAPGLRQRLIGQEGDAVIEMKVLDNELRIWIAPGILTTEGLTLLAEAAIPKDRYIAPGGIEALVVPPTLDSIADLGQKLFSGKIWPSREGRIRKFLEDPLF
jgi:hypothetical protein